MYLPIKEEGFKVVKEQMDHKNVLNTKKYFILRK